MAVDSNNTVQRRSLRFEKLDDIEADVEALVLATEIRTLGNWSLGQILWHLAKVMNDSIDGTTIQWTAPPPAIPEPIKRRVLSGSLRAGFKLPLEAAKELEPPETSITEGVRVFRAAVSRQRTETVRQPNPFFGPLTLDEWNLLQLRHAELHLSFVVPVAGSTAGS